MENIDLRPYIRDILDKELVMTLAVADEQGPWAAVVELGVDDNLTLYWLSAASTRHSLAIEKDPRVAATVTLPVKKNEQGVGLQIEGTAQVIQTNDYAHLALLVEAKREQPIRTSALDNRQWYALTPSKIYLLHEPQFGYNRLCYELPKN